MNAVWYTCSAELPLLHVLLCTSSAASAELARIGISNSLAQASRSLANVQAHELAGQIDAKTELATCMKIHAYSIQQ